MTFKVNSMTDLLTCKFGRCHATVAMLATLVMAHGSLAAPLSWNAAAGGSAATPANWNPVAMPAAADDLTFNLNAIYQVNFPATVSTSGTQTYRDGTVTLSNSATHTITNGLTVGDLNLDDSILTITTGIVNVNAATIVGDASGSIGRINVNDDDADLNVGNAADLTIGLGGNGTLSITGTGHVTVADQFIVGANASSTSSVTVDGFQAGPIGVSLLDVLGASQSRIGAGGDATLLVNDGATARFAGDLVVANGSASTSSITVQDQGLVNALLDVSGDLLIGRNTSGVAAGNGTLNLNTGGTADVTGDTFLGDPDGGTGLLHLNGGLFTGVGAINVTAGSTINGTGTINAPITNNGNINPTGAAGLTLGGILSNTTSNLITGTKIHFSNTGGYTGSGEVDADITGDTNALITATGTLDIGNNTTSGFSYNGKLDVGGSIVTLVDSNGVVLGGLTTINSGRIEAPSGLGIQNGATIQGDGLFVADIICSGILDPKTANAGAGGLFTVQGDLTFNPTGKMDMDLKGSPQSNAYDRINVSGEVNFGGTLRVKLPTGFVPKVGQQFIAVNAVQGRNGEFAAIEAPVPPPCNNVTFVLVYSSTAAIVLVRPPLGCTALGDLNSDGSVNGKDIQIFVNNVLNPSYQSCADMNGDCADDAGDITIFINAAT